VAKAGVAWRRLAKAGWRPMAANGVMSASANGGVMKWLNIEENIIQWLISK
jgi:hypothetical protein